MGKVEKTKVNDLNLYPRASYAFFRTTFNGEQAVFFCTLSFRDFLLISLVGMKMQFRTGKFLPSLVMLPGRVQRVVSSGLARRPHDRCNHED